MKVKKIILSFLILGSVYNMTAQQYKYPFLNPRLDTEKRVSNLISLLTYEEKINMFSGAGIQRFGIRSAGGTEAIHGIVQGGPAWSQNIKDQVTTIFPQGYGLGETWDPELIHQVGSTMAYEARYLFQSPKYQRCALILWAPNADMGRDIRWGRTEECYGEDPFLTGSLTVAMVKGIQGDNAKYWKGASLMKHFLANSNESGRAETSSDFDSAIFNEYYAYSFRRGIQDGGSNAIMTAYNSYNGIACTTHPILRDILMKQWGFNGIITTDGGAFQQLKNVKHLYDSHEEAAQACIKAGTTRFLDNYKSYLKNAVSKGLIKEKELDENIKGNLRVMVKLGLLDDSDDNPYKNIGIKDTIDPWTKQDTKDFVRLVADKSVVLLKNDNHLLPLDQKTIKKIAVIGNRADVILEDWYCGTLPYKITPLDGIKEIADKNGIEVKFVRDDKQGLAEKAAAWADVTIVCVGNDPTGSPDWGKAPWSKTTLASDGREDVDRTSLQLDQEDLIRLVYKANPKTITVLISSFPYAINWTQEHVPSILHVTQSCQELGHAVADVLFGQYNPAGRTTQTWVSSIDQLPDMMDYNIRHGRTYMYFKGKPLYTFGHGLSYTSFDYTNISTDKDILHQGDKIDVNITVRNSGNMDGEEVVQVYAKLPGDDAIKRLRGFCRTNITKGDSKTVKITLDSKDLALWNIKDNRFEMPTGTVTLQVGPSSDLIKLEKNILIK
jgi:beta-glucosidase